jgi:hypothetical protein
MHKSLILALILLIILMNINKIEGFKLNDDPEDEDDECPQ